VNRRQKVRHGAGQATAWIGIIGFAKEIELETLPFRSLP
jgi:hypothetical protein